MSRHPTWRVVIGDAEYPVSKYFRGDDAEATAREVARKASGRVWLAYLQAGEWIEVDR